MTLPASGPISFNAINVELGVAGTTQASLGQTSYRTLAGVASGQISMSNFYGKSSQFAFTISSNQTNANLRSLAVTAGWNQSSKVVATIGSGVYVSSNSTGTPGLTINGSFPGGVELVNNGFIIGMGGAGGRGGNYVPTSETYGVSGSSGGLALSVSTAVTITNNGTIGGGGGGGGGGGSGYTESKIAVSGGGGGGGGGRSNPASNSSGGNGGFGYQGNGGAGNPGTTSSAGSGGGGGAAAAGAGGAGGSWGASGSNGTAGSNAGPGGGGSGGGSVSGNGNVTWVATGTRLGALS